MKIKALIFDLDDTLVGSDDFYAIALKRIGISPTGKAFLSARSAIKKQLPKGHVSARNRLLYFKKMLEAHSNGLGALNLMERYEKELERLSRAQWKKLKRDRLFIKLRKRFRIVIVTNENLRTQLKKLRALDPGERYFEKIITSEEVGVEKPSPKAFQLALKHLKLRPSQCIAIGNSVDGDILPARRLGMRTVMTREFLPQGSAVPKDVSVVQALNEIENLFLPL